MDLNNLIKKLRYFYEISFMYEASKMGTEYDTPFTLDTYSDVIMARKEIREMIKTLNIIHSKVEKHSGKPFKSTLKTNTIKSILKNPNSGNPAFSFNEDDSVVDIEMCKIIK